METRFIFANAKLFDLIRGLLLVNAVLEFCRFRISPAGEKMQTSEYLDMEKTHTRAIISFRHWGPKLVNTEWEACKQWRDWSEEQQEDSLSTVQENSSDLDETLREKEPAELKTVDDQTSFKTKVGAIETEIAQSMTSSRGDEKPMPQPLRSVDLKIASTKHKAFFR